MIVLIRLKSFEVINLSIVEAKGVTEIVEGMARTVVSIVAMLMNMRVGIAVQNCHSQIVG
jgi:hypothetical protein